MEPQLAVLYTLVTAVGAVTIGLLFAFSRLYWLTESGLGENFKALSLLFESIQNVTARQNASEYLDANPQPMKH